MKTISIFSLGVWLTLVGTASAQITIPNTFVANTVASSSQVNANFSALGAGALNRAGGTITGNIVVDGGFTIDGVDLSVVIPTLAVATGPQSITGAWTFITAPSMAGTNISAIPEGNISDGTIFPRLFANEFITGSWTAPNFTLSAAGASRLYMVNSAGGVDAKRWEAATDGASWFLYAVNDAITASTAAMQFTRSGTTITAATLTANQINLTGTVAVNGTLLRTGALPLIALEENDQAVNGKLWAWIAEGGISQYVAYNDGFAGGGVALAFTRSGSAVTAATLAGTAITLSGNVTASGTLSAGATSVTTLAASSNASVGGTLGVTGVTTLGTVDITLGRFSNSNNIYTSGSYFYVGDPVAGATTQAGLQFFKNATPSMTVLVGNDSWLFTANGFYPGSAGNDIASTTTRINTIFLTNAPDVSSDRRLKQDIKTADLGIEFIDALNPVSYRLVEDAKTLHYGFIAQDMVRLRFPGVSVGTNGMLGLRYEEFIAPLTKGLQEVHAETHILERLVKKQENEIDSLRLRIAALESKLFRRVRAE